MTPHPLTEEMLVDYWLGELAAGESEAVEEHFFGCAECTSALEWIAAWAAQLSALARSGELRVVISQAFLDRMTEQGYRARQYAPAPGGSVACTITAADDLLIARFAADLAGQGRLDLSFCDLAGNEFGRMAEIPFNPASAEILYNESVSMARGMDSMSMVVRLMAVDESSERELAAYTFHHSRTV